MLAKEKRHRKQPKYEWQSLQAVMNTWMGKLVTITVEPKLSKRNNKWVLMLEEHYPEGTALGTKNLLDERLEWCVEKLKDWPGCKRMAYDQFWFDRKVEAEKFVTLYTLSWR